MSVGSTELITGVGLPEPAKSGGGGFAAAGAGSGDALADVYAFVLDLTKRETAAEAVR